MNADESGDDDKASEDAKQSAAAIARLPENGTQPGGAPRGTQEPGDSDKDAPKPSDRLPSAGPHANPDLTNPDATPGTGALTPPGEHDDVESTSG